MAFTVTSPAFRNGSAVPKQFTCDGSDTPPPLEVSGAPEGTQSFAVIMDDPDAPNGTFTHWLAYDVPAGTGELEVDRGRTLRNGFGREGYGGPCPPSGHGVHHYNITVYAVDVPSLDLRGAGRKDLERTLKTHTLATARLTGEYERLR